jgi:hypothetical protein
MANQEGSGCYQRSFRPVPAGVRPCCLKRDFLSLETPRLRGRFKELDEYAAVFSNAAVKLGVPAMIVGAAYSCRRRATGPRRRRFSERYPVLEWVIPSLRVLHRRWPGLLLLPFLALVFAVPTARPEVFTDEAVVVKLQPEVELWYSPANPCRTWRSRWHEVWTSTTAFSGDWVRCSREPAPGGRAGIYLTTDSHRDLLHVSHYFGNEFYVQIGPGSIVEIKKYLDLLPSRRVIELRLGAARMKTTIKHFYSRGVLVR